MPDRPARGPCVEVAPQTPVISLRPARADDYDFAMHLYLDTMQPLLTVLGIWDEARVTARFVEGYSIENVRVICSAGAVIGWMQISDLPEGLHLDQIHLVEGYRNRGIGTRLIQDLLGEASRTGRSVGLNVIRGNPALSLYEQLGFRIVGEDADKLQMCREAPAGTPSDEGIQ